MYLLEQLKLVFLINSYVVNKLYNFTNIRSTPSMLVQCSHCYNKLLWQLHCVFNTLAISSLQWFNADRWLAGGVLDCKKSCSTNAKHSLFTDSFA